MIGKCYLYDWTGYFKFFMHKSSFFADGLTIHKAIQQSDFVDEMHFSHILRNEGA